MKSGLTRALGTLKLRVRLFGLQQTLKDAGFVVRRRAGVLQLCGWSMVRQTCNWNNGEFDALPGVSPKSRSFRENHL